MMNKLFLTILKCIVIFPKIGEKWIFRSLEDGDPWQDEKNLHLATIIDVKDGWVRYKVNEYFPDERRKLITFLMCYKIYKG